MQKIKITSCSDVNQFPKASGLFLQLCDPVEKQTRNTNNNNLLPMQLTKKCHNKITINKWFYGKEIEIALKYWEEWLQPTSWCCARSSMKSNDAPMTIYKVSKIWRDKIFPTMMYGSLWLLLKTCNFATASIMYNLLWCSNGEPLPKEIDGLFIGLSG